MILGLGTFNIFILKTKIVKGDLKSPFIYGIINKGDFMLLSNEWIDYECLSAGNGEKLERWGNVILRRPDAQAMWPIKNSNLWNNIDAFYHRSNKGGG